MTDGAASAEGRRPKASGEETALGERAAVPPAPWGFGRRGRSVATGGSGRIDPIASDLPRMAVRGRLSSERLAHSKVR